MTGIGLPLGGGLLCFFGLILPLVVGFSYVYFQRRLRPDFANEEVSVESGIIGGGVSGLFFGFIEAIFGQAITISMLMSNEFGGGGLDMLPFMGITLIFGLCQSIIKGGILGAVGGAIGGAILGDKERA